MAPSVGEVVGGRYRLRAPLGHGGMGEVYLAERDDGERVAVKLLKPELGGEEELRRRFEQEARALANIRHPNVARFYQLLPGNPSLLVTEYVEGPNLREVIAREKRLPADRARTITEKLSWALHAVHAAGVIHRDLKPDNVVMTRGEDGTDMPKLIDFGLAKLGLPRHERLTRVGEVLGTPQYMAPEQVAGRDVDARADVYALGCVLYQMLVGTPPFPDLEGDAEVLISQVKREPTPVAELAPETPPVLVEVLAKMMAKLADDRFTNMIEVAHALATVAEPPPPGLGARLSRLWRGR